MNRLKHTCITLMTVAVLGLPLSNSVRAASPDELTLMQSFMGIMQGYYAVIESAHDIDSDAEKSAILQLQKIQEVYEQRGEKARVVDVLREVLESTRNQTIRNHAYLMMGDVLKETGRSEEALRMLREGLNENLAAVE